MAYFGMNSTSFFDFIKSLGKIDSYTDIGGPFDAADGKLAI